VTSGTAGQVRVWFVTNWCAQQSTLTIPHSVFDVAGSHHMAGSAITLEPWAVMVFADEILRTVDADPRT